MNRKGEAMGEMGSILVVFVAVIVGLALISASFGFIGTATNTVTETNGTYTTSATVNGSTEVTGMQELIGTTVFIQNNSDGVYLGDGNFKAGDNISIKECIGADSLKAVCIYPTTATATSKGINITGTYGPDGYIDSAGGRSIAGIIAIFACLAIAVTALVPSLRSEVLKLAGI